MDQNNRPRARRKNVTSGGSGVHKRGDGLGTGKVGSNSQAGQTSSGGAAGKRAAAGGGSLLLILALIFLPKLLGGGGGGGTSSGGGLGDLVGSMLGGAGSSPAGFSFANEDENNSGYSASSGGTVDNSVASGSRAKRTKILGNNQDTVTLMVYMCGTDLESKYGMASSDMAEMAAATYGDNVNIMLENMGALGLLVDEKTYYESARAGMEQYLQGMGCKIVSMEGQEVDFCGKPHYGMFLEASVNGVSFYERQVYIKYGSYMGILTAFSMDKTRLDDMIDMFLPYAQPSDGTETAELIPENNS